MLVFFAVTAVICKLIGPNLYIGCRVSGLCDVYILIIISLYWWLCL